MASTKRVNARDLFDLANAAQCEAAVINSKPKKVSVLWGTTSMVRLDRRAVAHVHPRDEALSDPRFGFHPSEADLYFSHWRSQYGEPLGWHAIISAAGVTVLHYKIACARSEVYLIPTLDVYIQADIAGVLQIMPNDGCVHFRVIPLCKRPMAKLGVYRRACEYDGA